MAAYLHLIGQDICLLVLTHVKTDTFIRICITTKANFLQKYVLYCVNMYEYC
jgi:hypothetical protein